MGHASIFSGSNHTLKNQQVYAVAERTDNDGESEEGEGADQEDIDEKEVREVEEERGVYEEEMTTTMMQKTRVPLGRRLTRYTSILIPSRHTRRSEGLFKVQHSLVLGMGGRPECETHV